MPKIQITLKDPDTLYDAVSDFVTQELANSGLPEDEQELLRETREEKYRDVCSIYFQYGEYVTIEIDTETSKARVVPWGEKEK